MQKPKKVIDLSKWNVVTDYSAIKRDGVDGAIVKVINGKNSPDGRLDTHVEGLRKAQIPTFAGYNYLYANTESKARTVAHIFFDLCKEKGIKQGWADIEDACMKNLGHIMPKIIDIYRNEAEKRGIYFGIYTGQSFYNSYIKPYISQIGSIPFWIARYPSATKEYKPTSAPPATPGLPTGIDIDGWQYTSKGVVSGVKGYTDISLWWEESPFVSKSPEITILVNPFTEPTSNVTAGTLGNDANWVLWYLWRFGLLLDVTGAPDQTKVDGMIDRVDCELVKEAQRRLGLTPDGIVGKVTRRTWKNVADSINV